MNNCEVRRNINEFFFVMWAIYMLMGSSGFFLIVYTLFLFQVYHAFYRPLEIAPVGRDVSQCYIKVFMIMMR